MNVPGNMILAVGTFVVFVLYLGFALGVLLWFVVALAGVSLHLVCSTVADWICRQ